MQFNRPFQYRILTPGDMRRLEEKAFSLGVSSLLLMEHAAIAVTDELQKALGGECRKKLVLFLCGTGNNGGDGLAAARLFCMRGGEPDVWLYGDPKTPDAQTNLRWLEQMDGVRIRNLSRLPENARCEWIDRQSYAYDAYVDALLGTGFRGEPDELMSGMMEIPYDHFLHTCFSPVIAVDIPSGIDGKTGKTPGKYIHADVTVTMNAPKPGLYLTNDREAVGRIVIARIGLDPLADSGKLTLETPELVCGTLKTPALRLLPFRSIGYHKGNCGRIAVYAGSLGMAGAAAMCAKAAVTAGAGLTTVVCDKEIIPILQALVPNAMCRDLAQAKQDPPAYDVLALGCGLGQSEEAWQNILMLWDPEKKSVWDADALNLLSKHPMKLGKNAVMTPHIGEAARLLDCTADQILEDRLAAARKLAEKYDCTAVLKSDVTVICSVNGDSPKYMLNTVGTPAMAKGGSGDALAGILAVLLYDAHDLMDSAALSCLWHGMAGIVGEEKFGGRELTTDQLISCLHEAEQWGRGERPAPEAYKG